MSKYKGFEVMSVDALRKACNELPDLAITEIIYSVLKQLGIKETKSLLTTHSKDFYEAIYKAIEDNTEIPFTTEEINYIMNHKK